MATQEFQYLDSVLKEWFAPTIVNQIYVKSPFWAVVKKTSKGVYGKNVYIPLRHTLSEAVGGNIANTYTLPTAGRIQYDKTRIWQKRQYGKVQVDGLAIAASKGKGGWIDQFAGETRGIAESFAIDIDNQVMGRGTGILATATGDFDGSDILTIDAPHGIADATPGYMWVRKGMLIDVIKHTDGTEIVGDVEVESIDPANNQFTATANPSGTTANGYFIVRANTASFDGSGNVTAETISAGNGVIMGLDRIVDNDQTDTSGDLITDFQGIDGNAAANNWWRAQVMRTSDTILTEMKIQEDLDTIAQNTDGDAPNLALTTYALRNKLLEIVKSDRMVSNINFVAGWEGIKYRGGAVSLPIMVHKFCPAKYWYYLNMKYIAFYTLMKLTWDTSLGGVIKAVNNEDQFYAWFKMYGNMGVSKRNPFGKATNYTTS